MSKDDELAVIGTMCQPLRRMPRGDKTAAVSMMCQVFDGCRMTTRLSSSERCAGL